MISDITILYKINSLHKYLISLNERRLIYSHRIFNSIKKIIEFKEFSQFIFFGGHPIFLKIIIMLSNNYIIIQIKSSNGVLFSTFY
jgi:hypothetical protein